MKYFVVACVLLAAGCGSPKDCVNEEGPWFSPQFLEENPQYASDMHLCSNYYKHQYVTKHTVPIVCGSKDGQCGITECECVCHK